MLGSLDRSTNSAMVEELVLSQTLTSPECIEAFNKIDRRHFWAGNIHDLAYSDMPLRRGNLHQSAPHIYAQALETMMPLRTGMSFLNVGSGTGYFSAIVSELIGDAAVNHGIEMWPENVEHATERCNSIGKNSISFTTGNVYQLDVFDCMRYDRIYVGACANACSKYLYGLLEIGGILICPFEAGGGSQQLRRVVRTTESRFMVDVLNSVQFATLVQPTPDPTLILPSRPSTSCLGLRVPTRPRPNCGLPGVPFKFALCEKPWSIERSLAFPVSFRRVADLVLKGNPQNGAMLCFPQEIWAQHVLPCCSRRWFEAPQLPIAPTLLLTPSSLATCATFTGQMKHALRPSEGRCLVSGTGGSSSTASNSRARGGVGSWFFVEVCADGQENIIGNPFHVADADVGEQESHEIRGPMRVLRLRNDTAASIPGVTVVMDATGRERRLHSSQPGCLCASWSSIWRLVGSYFGCASGAAPRAVASI
jgi:protein-L-isoaspartate(D-aspartate) O-methyltransferase